MLAGWHHPFYSSIAIVSWLNSFFPPNGLAGEVSLLDLGEFITSCPRDQHTSLPRIVMRTSREANVMPFV